MEIIETINKILEDNPAVYSHRYIASEEDLGKMVSSDELRAVGFSIYDFTLSNTTHCACDVNFIVVDVCNNDTESIVDAVSSCMNVVKEISNHDKAVSDNVQASISYVRDDSNDMITVIISATIKFL